MNYSKIISSWVEVSQSALEHNIALYKSVIGPVKLAIVIKSNAYGCDLGLVGKLLDANQLVDYLCVSSLTEAVFLRELGLKKSILVLSVLDCDLQQAVINPIDLTVFDLKTVLELNRLGELHQKKVKIHVKIDTGMSRLGLFHDQVLSFIKAILKLKFIEIIGIFTHYAASDRSDLTSLEKQAGIFNQVILDLEKHEIAIPIKHTANTAAITADCLTHFNMVRVGIGVYGMWPSPENQLLTQAQYPDFVLKPVLTWKTRILTIKELPIGSYVGYDQAYQTTKPAKIATIPVGYYEGYDRRLSNQGQVLINGCLVPVVGKVAMNLTMVDVTGVDAVVGDEVTLIGHQVGVQPDDLAQICQTANTEITAKINPLINRKIVL